MYLINCLARTTTPHWKGNRYRMALELLATEAANLIGVTRDYIIKLARRGQVKGEKKGRDWWVDKESLLAFYNNRRPVGRPEGSLSKEPARNRRGTGAAAEAEREYHRNYAKSSRAAGPLKSKKAPTKKRGDGKRS